MVFHTVGYIFSYDKFRYFAITFLPMGSLHIFSNNISFNENFKSSQNKV